MRLHTLPIWVLLALLAYAFAEPSVEPKFRQTKRYGTNRVQCSFGYPLADCQVRFSEHFYRRFDAVLNFRAGAASASSSLSNGKENPTTASYFGDGLAAGQCGVQLDGVASGVYLVECFGRKESGGWAQGFGLFTASARAVLPWDVPESALLVKPRGSAQSVSLQSPSTEWVGCSIRTPHSGKLELASGQSFPVDRRYKQQGGALDAGGCGFEVPDLQQRDAGVWDWYAETGASWVTGSAVWHAAVVLVEEGPQGQPTLRLRHPGPLKEGQLLEAECWAPAATPPVKLSWLLDGELVRSDSLNDTQPLDLGSVRPWESRPTRQTFVRRLTAGDDGKTLLCRVEHETLDKPSTAQVVLTNIGTLPTVVAETTLVRSAEGNLAELACIVQSRGPVVVRWLRDGSPVVPTPLVVVGNEGSRHWLRLEDVALADFADYTCAAEGAAGTATQNVLLTGLPGMPTLAASSSGSSLAWLVETYAPIIGITLKVREGKGPWHVVPASLDLERVNLSSVLVRHEFEAGRPGEHSAYLVAMNAFGASPSSGVHSFVAALSATTPSTSSADAACPPLASTSVAVRCSRAGAVVSCAGPVPTGTTARFACRPGYRLPEPHPGQLTARCSAQGNWSRSLFECTPDCGRRNGLGARPTVFGGQQASGAEFPWHAGLYRQDAKQDYQAICGGTLITPTLVVSAAHCVWDERNQAPLAAAKFRVALGKHTRRWQSTDAGEQRVRVGRVHVPQRYAGNLRKLESDIAVLELAASVVLTLSVNVVCVDWETEFEWQHFTAGSNGTVPGWGVDESSAPSETLRYVDLPFVPFRECHDSVPDDFRPYITRDKICAGFQDRSTSVCQGDSGGGLVFPAQRQGGTRYFLRAVVSSAPLHRAAAKACQSEHRAAFTALSAHSKWLEDVVYGRPEDSPDKQ